MKETTRNYLFDNLKVLLIFLVVFGHLLERYIDKDLFLRSIYIFIFMFHMPLFIFVSGYFSKNLDKCRRNAIKDLLIPYIVFNIIWYLSVGDYKFPLYNAGWTLWYLISLFFFRFFLKDIINVKYVLVLSIILGLLIGFVSKYNNFLSFTRTFAFLPFFLLGYYSNNSTVNKIKKYHKMISILGLVSIGLFAFILSKYEVINYRFLYMFQSYGSFGLGPVQGVLLRTLFYVLAVLTSIFLINLIPNKEFKLSQIGTDTMLIYLGHIYIIKLLNKYVPVFNRTITDFSILIVFSVLICAFLSLPIFLKIYNYVFAKLNYLIGE